MAVGSMYAPCMGPSLCHTGLLACVCEITKASAYMKESEQWTHTLVELPRMLAKLVLADEDYLKL